MMKRVLTLIVFFSISLMTLAQPMRFETFNAAYSPLTGATNMTDSFIWDDPEYDLDNPEFKLGFNIKGIGKFSDTAIMNDGYFYIEDEKGDIAFYLQTVGVGVDLVDRGYIDEVSALSPILTKTTGTAGNRIFHIEWKNFGFLNEYNDSNTLNDYGNIQVRIFEQDGSIEVHYGPAKVDSRASLDGLSGYNIFVGKLDFSNLDLQGMALAGNPMNPTVKYNDWNGVLSSLPEPGRVYKFRFNLDSATAGTNEVSSVKVKTYPQPATEILSIDLPDTKSAALCQIYSIKGQLLMTETLESENHQISVASLKSGLYILKVAQDGKFYHAMVQVRG
jgi:hypothetical protein